MQTLRSIIVTDTPDADIAGADVILWVGAGRPPAQLASEAAPLMLTPSSLHAAAVYTASGPAVLRLALAEPLAFLTLLARVARAPALRAA